MRGHTDESQEATRALRAALPGSYVQRTSPSSLYEVYERYTFAAPHQRNGWRRTRGDGSRRPGGARAATPRQPQLHSSEAIHPQSSTSVNTQTADRGGAPEGGMAKKQKSPKAPEVSKRKVGPAPTVISANLKTMKSVSVSKYTPERKELKKKAKQEKHTTATQRAGGRKDSSAEESTSLKESGVKEKSLISVMLGKCFKSFVQKTIKLQHPQAIKMSSALGLGQRHLRIMKDQFDDIDVDGSGNIDAVELFEAMGEIKSKITDELFRMMDMDGNARLDFDEYVAVALSYCMYTKDDILKFCFELFDLDGGGTIDEKEFIEMCVSVSAGDPLFAGNFKMALENFDVNDDGLIDFEEFQNMNNRYPMILHPAFRMQDKLQKYTLGEDEWVRVMENINYWLKLKDAQDEDYKQTRWEKLREGYFFRCCGHPPVDLDYIASQSKMNQSKAAAELEEASRGRASMG